MYRLTAIRRGMAAVALGFVCALPAHGADRPLDWTFDGVAPRNRGTEKLYYRIGEASGLQIVPREAGAPPNEHPVQLDPAIVKQQLLLVVLEDGRDGKGKVEPLFGEQEAADISVELVKALATATATQDVLLFSSSRRDQVVLMPPTGLSARFFVEKGRLNVIVAQPRVEYFGQWRVNPSIKPTLVFGSRTAASKTPLQGPPGVIVRNDWAALPLVASVTAPVAAPAARPAVAPAVVPPAAAPALAPAPAAAPSTDPEQRLRTLKRLRDNNLISEEEFQQKKTEILKTL